MSDRSCVIALEKQLETLRWYATPAAKIFTRLDMKEATDFVHEFTELAISQAEPYYVSREIKQMLVDALPSLPPETTVDWNDLPSPCGWVYFEEPFPLPKTANGIDMPMNALAWGPVRRPKPTLESPYWHKPTTDEMVIGFAVYSTLNDREVKAGRDRERFMDAFGISTLSLQFSWFTYWAPGADVSSMHTSLDAIRTANAENSYDLTEEKIAQATERAQTAENAIASLLHFIKQRFVGREHVRADRATARRFEKERNAEAPLIQTIILRAAEHRPNRRKDDDDPKGRWSVRSVRRAHWHNYWCGGKSADCLDPGHATSELELRYVQATICGPDGAPVKDTTKLFAVVR